MQHIDLSYTWQPDPAGLTARASGSALRNPLMALLQAVHGNGSISAAARQLGLSYRHVWGELKRWEGLLAQPLIVWEKGQAARLSEFGEKLLWAERQAQARLAPQISALQAELEKTFAMAFDPDSHLLTLYASHDEALVRLREHAAGAGLHLDMRFCGSVDAIRALNEGRCTVAGFHAPELPAPGSLIARTYAPLLQTGQHKLIAFASRQQGLMVAPGNPLRLQGWQDLTRAEVRFVNRTLGSGTRLLLDNWLQGQDLKASAIRGYGHEEPSHVAVATRVASGQADAGLGIASAAQAAGLDFIPLLREHDWLVCLKSALDSPAVTQLRAVLAQAAWLQWLSDQPGYAPPEAAGQVQSLKQCLPWW